MQFSPELREAVAAGEITLTFRLWSRPQVKEGGRYRVAAPAGGAAPAGWIEVDSIDEVPFASVTRDDLRRTGERDLDALRRRTAHAGPVDDDTVVYRIEFHAVGDGSAPGSAPQRAVGEAGAMATRKTPGSNMDRLEATALAYPEAERVDVEAWGDHPTFRVRKKNFVFADGAATHLSVKLPPEEAEAVVASDPRAAPAGYGLGRHGWVAVTLEAPLDDDAWAEVAEWIDASYRLVAPKRLVAQLDDGGGPGSR